MRKKPKIVIEITGRIPSKSTFENNLDIEDGGQAMIVHIGNGNHLGVELISWDESKKHTVFKSLMGRKVKIVITTEDNDPS